MRLRNSLAWLLLSAFGLFGLTACGGGDDEATAATAPAATPTTTAPRADKRAAATSTIPTAAPPAVTGTVLDSALPFAPVEVDNVKYVGVFTYANQNSLGALDPKFNSQSILNVGRWFYEKAVGWAPNANDGFAHLAPQLVESWKISQDQKTYTFAVRKGVKWHKKLIKPGDTPDDVGSFIASQTSNSRPATAKKAAIALKRLKIQ